MLNEEQNINTRYTFMHILARNDEEREEHLGLKDTMLTPLAPALILVGEGGELLELCEI